MPPIADTLIACVLWSALISGCAAYFIATLRSEK